MSVLQAWPYAIVAGFGLFLVLAISWTAERRREETIARYRIESSDIAHRKAAAIETRLALLYQGLRTIARLPGVRSIDRYGKNFDTAAKRSTQEIYNNLALNVSVSEVYIVPAGFDPDAIDPHTGEPQEPIIQFDHLIEGRTANSPAKGLPVSIDADADKPAREEQENPDEIEIFEYREMRDQYGKLAAKYGSESQVRNLAYPSIASTQVVTCDNSRFSPEHPDDDRRSGVVLSVPFYGQDGRIKGMVSAVLLTDVIAEMLAGGEEALVNTGYGYRALATGFKPTEAQRHALSKGLPDMSLIYGELIPLETADAFSPWKLWASRDDGAYWARDDVRALSTISQLAYLCAGVLTALLLFVVYWQRRFAYAARNRHEELETKVRERTRELELARDAAAADNEAKSVFLANMSHEFRTPLNSIMGFSDILLQELFGQLGDKRYKSYAGDIWAAGSHLLALVNDILELSRVEAGKLQLHDEPVRVAEVAQDVLRIVAAAARDARAELAVDIGDGTTRLNVDLRRLTQILINLMTNAIKFTPASGTVTLSFRIEGIEPVFCVSDTGIGMTPEQIKLALTPFGQVDNDLSRKQVGTGLGLPLSKSLTEAMGGSMTIDSVPGGGTKITLRLPAWRLIDQTAVRCVA